MARGQGEDSHPALNCSSFLESTRGRERGRGKRSVFSGKEPWNSERFLFLLCREQRKKLKTLSGANIYYFMPPSCLDLIITIIKL